MDNARRRDGAADDPAWPAGASLPQLSFATCAVIDSKKSIASSMAGLSLGAGGGNGTQDRSEEPRRAPPPAGKASESSSGVFFFGEKKSEPGKGRRQAATTSQSAALQDTVLTEERRRTMEELARYEKIQLAERDQQRQRERERAKEEENSFFPFGRQVRGNPRIVHATEVEQRPPPGPAHRNKQEQYQREIADQLQQKEMQKQQEKEAKRQQPPDRGLPVVAAESNEPQPRIKHFSEHQADSLKVKDPQRPNLVYDHLAVPGAGAPLVDPTGQPKTGLTSFSQQVEPKRPAPPSKSTSPPFATFPFEQRASVGSGSDTRGSLKKADSGDVAAKPGFLQSRALDSAVQTSNSSLASSTGRQKRSPDSNNAGTDPITHGRPEAGPQFGRRATAAAQQQPNTDKQARLSQYEQAMLDEQSRRKQEVEQRRQSEREWLNQDTWWFSKGTGNPSPTGRQAKSSANAP